MNHEDAKNTKKTCIEWEGQEPTPARRAAGGKGLPLRNDVARIIAALGGKRSFDSAASGRSAQDDEAGAQDSDI